MPSVFDSKVPPTLLASQSWFAQVITRPIDGDSRMLSISPSGRPMSEEAADYITPNERLGSAERIQIYNQQYWWRLLSTLQENFPTLTRLFGYTDFNRSLATPFLLAHPSHHFSLARLGDKLSDWIDECYIAPDKALALSSAQIDWAYQALFVAPSPLPISPSLDLLSKKMRLQPHLRLFTLPFNLFSFRAEFLKKDVDHWTEAMSFPPLREEGPYFFLLYRTSQNLIQYREIEQGQWTLLHLIAGGASLDEACNELEAQGGSGAKEAQGSLHLWIQEWIREMWLIPEIEGEQYEYN